MILHGFRINKESKNPQIKIWGIFVYSQICDCFLTKNSQIIFFCIFIIGPIVITVEARVLCYYNEITTSKAFSQWKLCRHWLNTTVCICHILRAFKGAFKHVRLKGKWHNVHQVMRINIVFNPMTQHQGQAFCIDKNVLKPHRTSACNQSCWSIL